MLHQFLLAYITFLHLKCRKTNSHIAMLYTKTLSFINSTSYYTFEIKLLCRFLKTQHGAVEKLNKNAATETAKAVND